MDIGTLVCVGLACFAVGTCVGWIAKPTLSPARRKSRNDKQSTPSAKPAPRRLVSKEHVHIEYCNGGGFLDPGRTIEVSELLSDDKWLWAKIVDGRYHHFGNSILVKTEDLAKFQGA